MKLAAIAIVLSFTSAAAAFAAPDYQETMLQSIFPAGAARGQTVEVRFQGVNGSLQNATEVKIDAIQREAPIPWQIPETLPPGEHELLISDGWAGETRKGLPGPCTPIIRLRVAAPE